jgi:hypothetical protein
LYTETYIQEFELVHVNFFYDLHYKMEFYVMYFFLQITLKRKKINGKINCSNGNIKER